MFDSGRAENPLAEKLKAKVIVESERNRETLDLCDQLTSSEKFNRNLTEENSILRDQLSAYERAVWSLTKCECKDPMSSDWRTMYRGWKCDKCDWNWFYWDKPARVKNMEKIFVAVDYAFKWSEDKTCITKFKQNKDGTIEILETKLK